MKKKLFKMLKSVSETPKIKVHAFIQPVQENMEGFTRREVKDANNACKAQVSMGHQSNAELLNLVSGSSGITNVPVTAHAISNANAIYGKDLGGYGEKQ